MVTKEPAIVSPGGNAHERSLCRVFLNAGAGQGSAPDPLLRRSLPQKSAVILYSTESGLNQAALNPNKNSTLIKYILIRTVSAIQFFEQRYVVRCFVFMPIETPCKAFRGIPYSLQPGTHRLYARLPLVL